MAVRIHRADVNAFQHCEKLSVLVRHVIADHAQAKFMLAFFDIQFFVQAAFAFVKDTYRLIHIDCLFGYGMA